MAGSVALCGGVGCTTLPPRADFAAQRYRIEVWLDPASHGIVGRTAIDLVRRGSRMPGDHPVRAEFLLHPDLKVTRVVTSGAHGRYAPLGPSPAAGDGAFIPRSHAVALDHDVDAFSLDISFEGTLWQDVERGERPGEIHNFSMRAHVATEGVYLADGYWYPQPSVADGDLAPLADFVLVAGATAGLELVAGAEPDPILSAQTGRLAWHSPYPLREIVLVGGPHEVHREIEGDALIAIHLPASQRALADPWLRAARRTIERYEPLIGPLPTSRFTMVTNFFSSGFAFPTFTLLSPAVIGMGERAADTHGYLDHEMLHCWWGNGVHVDPRDGNWCESLTSYATNYYGHVLDGNEPEARRVRRNCCHFLSRVTPDDDRPLGTYDRPGGCSRAIAYQKGAMVFHMLARRAGQDAFWATMRKFNAEHIGRYASWEDIQLAAERSTGSSLKAFFEQWVRRRGAPSPAIMEATYDTEEEAVTLVLVQEEPPFDLEVPVRITHSEGVVDVVVPLHETRAEVTVPLDVEPVEVELDPDFHLFRRVPANQIIPTTATVRSGGPLAIVRPAGDAEGALAKLTAAFTTGDRPEPPTTLIAGGIEPGALAERSAVILGAAVNDPYVAGFLTATEFPVRFPGSGFEFEGQLYAAAGHAVLCTVHHPGLTRGGVTVVFANSEEAFPTATAIPMYDSSLVIFENRRPILRRDFERRQAVPVDE